MTFNKHKFVAMVLVFFMTASLLVTTSLSVSAEPSRDFNAASAPAVNVLPTVPTIISATLSAGVLVVVGTAQAGATVNVYDANLHLLGTTVADANGNFSLNTTNTSGIIPGTSLVVGTTTVCVLNQCLISLTGAPVLVIGVGSVWRHTAQSECFRQPIAVSVSRQAEYLTAFMVH